MPATCCHPLSWLTGWVAFVIGLQWLSDPLWLGFWLAAAGALAAIAAPERSWALLVRARWLFLSLGLLFVFFTPGEFVPGLPQWSGITREGLTRAYDQLARLSIMLATLAVLHQRLGSQGLLAGLYALLRPFSMREATIVRLMLVLEHVESRERLSWREWLSPAADRDVAPDGRLTIQAPALRPRDAFLMLAALTLVVAWIAAA